MEAPRRQQMLTGLDGAPFEITSGHTRVNGFETVNEVKNPGLIRQIEHRKGESMRRGAAFSRCWRPKIILLYVLNIKQQQELDRR